MEEAPVIFSSSYLLSKNFKTSLSPFYARKKSSHSVQGRDDVAVSKARISAFGHSLIRCTVLNAGVVYSTLIFSSSADTKAFLGPTCSFRSCGDLGFRYAE